MVVRWFVGLALLAALAAGPIAPAQAQDSGASLEYTGGTDLTLRAYGGRSNISGRAARNPFAGCFFTVGGAASIRPWIRSQYVDMDGLDEELYSDDLAWFDELAAQGTDFTFGGETEDIVAGFCPASGGQRFRSGTQYTWWTRTTGTAQVNFEAYWREALDSIDFPDLTVMTSPNANTPFLTQLAVGLSPAQTLQDLPGAATVPGVQTIDVIARPRPVEFEVDGRPVATCAAPFPSVEEMINELEPACSATFEEPTPPGTTAALTMVVRYDIETVCNPACTFPPPAPAVLSAEIPIAVVEALGLN